MVNRREAFIPFVQHMAPAIEQGLGRAAVLPGTSFDERRSLLETSVVEAVYAMDWSSIESPPVAGSTQYEPREVATHLIKVAFGDLEQLVDLARRAKQTLAGLEAVSLSDLLSRSKRPLLRIAHLPDAERGTLFYYTLHHDLAGLRGLPMQVEVDPEGKPMLNWRPEFKDWIQKNTILGRGCPASGVFVEHEGRRVSLLEFFWNGVIEASFSRGGV
jgi:hypothetical protein